MRKKDTYYKNALDEKMTLIGLYFVLFHGVLSHQLLIQLLINIKQNNTC